MSSLGALYGRDAEADVIATLLDGAHAGRSGAVVISGPAGIGKTALLEFAERASAGMTVLRATAIETEAELPFAGLHMLLRPVLSQLPKIPARQAGALERAFGVGPGWARPADDVFLAGLAVLSLLTEVADARPVLCLIDDAQWLDGASAAALMFAARRLDAEGVAVLLAIREGPRQLPTSGLTQLDLGPLSADAGQQVLRDAADSLDPILHQRVLADGAGNPLAITELARAAETVPDHGYYGRPGPLPIGQRLQQLFGQQVSTLPESTRMLLLLASAAGAGELTLILSSARSLGLDAAAFGPAEQAGLVTVTDDRLVFRHPLVRAAVYHDAPIAQRQDAHGALADALVTGPADNASRRAWHLASAASGPDDDVARELELAAEQARDVSGYAAVAAAYERSAELTTASAARTRRLLAAAAAASDIGQSARADRLLQEAESFSNDPLVRVEAAYLRSRNYAADHRETLTALADATAGITGSHPDRALRLLRVLVVAARNSGEFRLAEAAAARLEELQTAVALAATGDGPPDVVLSPHELLISAVEAWWRGDDDAALKISVDLAADCRERGMVSSLAGVLHCQGLALTARGHWLSAQATLLEALHLAADIGQPVRVSHAARQLAMLAAVTGDETACQSWLAAYEKDDVSGDAWRYCTALPAYIELGRGNFGAALDLYRAGLTEAEWRDDLAFWYQADIVEAAARAADRAWASEVAGVFGDWANRTGQPWALAVAARCRGVAELAGGPERHFDDALGWHADCDRPHETARTRLVYGEWLRREKRRTAAAAQLIAAIEIFDGLGAADWAQRARSELAATGQAAARAHAPGVLARLTPQEYQIVRLAALGHSNREIATQLFLSHRTVGYHLYKAYPKLGISSRTQLAGLLPVDDPELRTEPSG
jgi:DNA-binding CsgD family transcriptional regulator